jgi:hypothetical protein
MTLVAASAPSAGDPARAPAGPGSSTAIPKSVAIPARPDEYPCPTARTFHAPWRRYSSARISAVSIVRPVGSNRTRSRPDRSRTATDRPRTPAKVGGPDPSRLPVSTTLSMSGGTAARVNSIADGGSRRTPGPVG